MPASDQLALRNVVGGCILPVKVVCGSSGNRIVGALGESLKVATSSPPEKGKANAAVAATLAAALGVPPRDVQLVSAPANPRKEFRIAGLSADEVRTRLRQV